MKHSAILIDDESNCTDLLRVMLEKYCPQVEVAGIYNDAEQALEALRTRRPELVFLDIEMPRLNGFDLLQKLMPVSFRVIFTTAYDQYAVRAIRFNALDYLLKPIDKEELIAGVERALTQAAPPEEKIQAVKQLRENPMPLRIALPVGQELVLVEVADILYCESEGSYVSVFVQGNSRPVVITKSLREVEELLNNPAFFRAHNSYLIHLAQIAKIVKTEGAEVVMKNGAALPVSRTKKQELMALIAKG